MCILILGGVAGCSSSRNASRDESVETGDEFIEAGEKHNNHVIMCSIMKMANYIKFQRRYTSYIKDLYAYIDFHILLVQ